MEPSRRPSDDVPRLPIWKIGIEQTRGAPRPWIFNEEEARRHRELHPSLLRRMLMKLGLLSSTR